MPPEPRVPTEPSPTEAEVAEQAPGQKSAPVTKKRASRQPVTEHPADKQPDNGQPGNAQPGKGTAAAEKAPVAKPSRRKAAASATPAVDEAASAVDEAASAAGTRPPAREYRPVEYPDLRSGPYEVSPSDRRSRFWSSTSPVLNQGASSGVVGYVWTHWLADRGVEAPSRVAFDGPYADQLYLESQSYAGLTGPDAGGYVDAAAEVLRTRGLVEAVYTCRTPEETTSALLERGPVIAGLQWLSSMDQPVEVDGWFVEPVGPGGTLRGGHAVLLNGVDLDLELNGTRGFYRFKNSWGSEWGQGGQCLISIAAFAALAGTVVYFPVPSERALRPGGSQRTAIEEDPAALPARRTPDIASERAPQAAAASSGPRIDREDELGVGASPDPSTTSDSTAPDAPTDPAAQPEVNYTREAIGSDVWTTVDTVGYSAYADAIARGLQHEDTKPPLTIGIKAPWGAGKTSLMRMIRERLDPPVAPTLPGQQPQLRMISLNADSKNALRSGRDRPTGGEAALPEVTNATVLQRLSVDRRPSRRSGGGPALDATSDGTVPLKAHLDAVVPSVTESTGSPPVTDQKSRASVPRRIVRTLLGRSGGDSAADPPRSRDPESHDLPESSELSDAERAHWRPTVWFNPWMYQTGEQVWAGLAHEIITQVTGRMSLVEREHFWLELNRSRIDEQAVRRKIYGLVIDRLLPLVLAAVFFLVAGGALALFGVGWKIPGSLAAVGPAVLGLVGLARYQGVRNAPLTGSLAQLVSPATKVEGVAASVVGGSVDQLVRQPDYKGQTGFFYLFHSDLERVINLVATDKRPLIVFVDDLDRCSPGTVVQVIEAINLFLAGQFSNGIFVIAMEPEMVAAHIEAAYEDLVAKLTEQSEDGAGVDLGWRFLEKIVQLPITLPAMDPSSLDDYYASLFPHGETTTPLVTADVAQDGATTVGEDVEDAGTSPMRSMAATPTGGAMAPTAVVLKAEERQLRRESPEVKAVIEYARQHLGSNPREIKRFVNVFRFYAMIHTERRLQGLPTAPVLTDVAKLAVLAIRWPGLLGVLAETISSGDSRTVFAVLEEPLTLDAGDGESETDARLRLLTLKLRSCGLDQRTVNRLVGPDFVRFMEAGPTIGPGAAGYL